MQKKFINRLIDESSPYLLQHAHNPVDWYPWGEEALQKAIVENKIILVSIGYSACHWCHVMEKESFEDDAVAGLMNENFVNIKIDREERPDLDHIYMDAVQAMTGSGGWPLNVFLTPEAKPFYGGTYFPPVKAYNRSSWTEVLNGIQVAWKERADEIRSQAEKLTVQLQLSNDFGLRRDHTESRRGYRPEERAGRSVAGNLAIRAGQGAGMDQRCAGPLDGRPAALAVGESLLWRHRPREPAAAWRPGAADRNTGAG